MTIKCELGDCQNEENLNVEMYSFTNEGLQLDPMAVCLDCYEEHGFEEY
jgi:hypothetical protein